MQPSRNTAQDRQEGIQEFFGGAVVAYLMAVYSDPDYPEFVPIFSSVFNVLGPVPDTAYTYTQIDGAGTYRIRGFRNTVRYVELTLNTGMLVDGTMKPVNSIDLDSLKLNPDTSFELILSPQRPVGYTGNWVQTTPDMRSILVRSQSYDWLHEQGGVMGIERLDKPTLRPRPPAEETAKRLAAIAPLAQEIQASSYRRVAQSLAKNLYNKVEGREYGGPGYVKVYLEGLFDIADDEALVIETEVPKVCRYWSVILLDNHKGALDWVNHQSSLNGFQAKLDSDGKFRGVIALHDPGVPNWLDPGGHAFGTMQIRWDKCSSAPAPTFHKVKLKKLRDHLPKDTPVATAEAREMSLRDRRLGAQLRRKW
jgi:hypothetical protein